MGRYLFPQVPHSTGTEFVAEAIRNNLLIIPGNVFSRRDTHFRISYAADDRTIDAALNLIASPGDDRHRLFLIWNTRPIMQSEPNIVQTPFQIEVAERVRRLPPYLFGKINALKQQKRRAGIDIIDLGMGDPTDAPWSRGD